MPAVEIEPDPTARRIRTYLRSHPDLIYDTYRTDEPLSLNGACYVASEAYYHAKGGEDSGLDIYCLSWSDVDPAYDGTHWYLRRGDAGPWVDISLDEPAQAHGIPFDQGTRRAFITGYEPSKRTQTVLLNLGLTDA